jgi:hypothetical protein
VIYRYRVVVLSACVGAIPALALGPGGCSSDAPLGPLFFDASAESAAPDPTSDAAADGADATTNVPFDAAEAGPPDVMDDGMAQDGEASVDPFAPEGGPMSEEGPAGNPGDGGPDAPVDASGDGGLTPTEQALYNIDPTCLACALANDALTVTGGDGSNCEEKLDSTLAMAAVDQFDPAASANCIATLTCALTTGCAAADTGDTTPCLCGTVDDVTCSSDTGSTVLKGNCTADYYAGYGTMDVTQFVSSFYDPNTSPGSANNLVYALSGVCLSCFPTGGDH